jgi:hypothetical protein
MLRILPSLLPPLLQLLQLLLLSQQQLLRRKRRKKRVKKKKMVTWALVCSTKHLLDSSELHLHLQIMYREER